MADKSLRRTLVGVAVAAALGVVGGAANARSYSVPFDPYEFAGVGIFTIDDTCLTIGTGYSTNTGNVGDSDPYCGISLDSLVVSLYPEGNTTHLPADLLGTLTFDPTISGIFDVAVLDGVPVGIDSDILGYKFAQSPGSPRPTVPFWAEFVAPDVFENIVTFGPLAVDPNAYPLGLVNLYEGTCENLDFPDFVQPLVVELSCSPNLLSPNVASVISITAVPEPGTLGLLLGALGGGWLARRRKQPAG